jgi:hypothetical protein
MGRMAEPTATRYLPMRDAADQNLGNNSKVPLEQAL